MNAMIRISDIKDEAAQNLVNFMHATIESTVTAAVMVMLRMTTTITITQCLPARAIRVWSKLVLAMQTADNNVDCSFSIYFRSVCLERCLMTGISQLTTDQQGTPFQMLLFYRSQATSMPTMQGLLSHVSSCTVGI